MPSMPACAASGGPSLIRKPHATPPRVLPSDTTDEETALVAAGAGRGGDADADRDHHSVMKA